MVQSTVFRSYVSTKVILKNCHIIVWTFIILLIYLFTELKSYEPRLWLKIGSVICKIFFFYLLSTIKLYEAHSLIDKASHFEAREFELHRGGTVSSLLDQVLFIRDDRMRLCDYGQTTTCHSPPSVSVGKPW